MSLTPIRFAGLFHVTTRRNAGFMIPSYKTAINNNPKLACYIDDIEEIPPHEPGVRHLAIDIRARLNSLVSIAQADEQFADQFLKSTPQAVSIDSYGGLSDTLRNKTSYPLKPSSSTDKP
jgi:hypothetical protein